MLRPDVGLDLRGHEIVPLIEESVVVRHHTREQRTREAILVSFTLEGPLSVIFQSGIFKIPSDHQAQDSSAFYERAREKVGQIGLIYQIIMVV